MHARSGEWKQTLCSLFVELLLCSLAAYPFLCLPPYSSPTTTHCEPTKFSSSRFRCPPIALWWPSWPPQNQPGQVAGPGPWTFTLAARPALTCECTALCCSRLTAWPKVLPHMSQAKGLVPLCERRTCTSRPCGVEKTWGDRAHRVRLTKEKEKSHNQCGRNRSLPCCTWHICKSQCWWAMGGTIGLTPLWCHLGPSLAAAQAVFRHRVWVVLLVAAQTALGLWSWSHHKVRGKSYTLHCRGQAQSLARRRAPGLRFAPASGRACSFAQGASAQSHPGCSTCTVWRAPRRGVLHLRTDTQIALRLQKQKGMEISALHNPGSITRQSHLSTQTWVQSQNPVLHIMVALSSLMRDMSYCMAMSVHPGLPTDLLSQTDYLKQPLILSISISGCPGVYALIWFLRH